jgi:hypothetical protein
MGVVLAPIVDGKLDAWKEWIAEMQGAKSEEFKDFNRRYGLTRHAAWLAETPMGPMVIALHEGPGSDGFIANVGASDNEFDKVWFNQKLIEIHGMDTSQPPPGPMPELYLDSGQ